MGKRNLKPMPWNSNPVDFGKDLKAGKKGQEKVVRAGAGLLKELDGRKNDLELVRTKEKVELKTERYKLNSTKNIVVKPELHLTCLLKDGVMKKDVTSVAHSKL